MNAAQFAPREMWDTGKPENYGEESEPFWRLHDSDLLFDPGFVPAKGGSQSSPRPRDPDWDDSHWLTGERFWLGHEYHHQGIFRRVWHFFGMAHQHYPDA